jgi:hypothetical protein
MMTWHAMPTNGEAEKKLKAPKGKKCVEC